MTCTDSTPPAAVDQLPARAKRLRPDTGSFPIPMARKPALELRDPEGLRRQRAVAIAFGEVLDEAGISNVQCAEWMGLSEVVVRNYRSRKALLPFDKVLALPEDIRTALLAKALERMRLNDSLDLMPEALRADAPAPGNDHYVARPR